MNERLTIARAELHLARRRLDEAQRAFTDLPATWHMFILHWRDTHRHGLMAAAICLDMDPGEAPAELAKRLVNESKAFEEHLPNRVANSEHFVAMIDVDREEARHDWEHRAADSIVALDLSMLQAFVEDVSALIEPPKSGIIIDINIGEAHSGEGPIRGTVTVVRWLRRVGETVERHEALAELSWRSLPNAERTASGEVATNKLSFTSPSRAAGTLSAIFVNEGETVPIDTVLATIETA